MGVAADDDAVGRVQALRHIDAAPYQALAGVTRIVGTAFSHSALMHDGDQQLRALGPQLRNQSVHGIGLVNELQSTDCLGHNDLGCVSRDGPHQRDFHASHHDDFVRRQNSFPRFGVQHIDRQIGKVSAFKFWPCTTAGSALTSGLAQQFGQARVQIVVTQRAGIQPHGAERAERGFISQHRRQLRGGAHQIACRHKNTVGALRSQIAQYRSQVGHTASGLGLDLAGLGIGQTGHERRGRLGLNMPMKVVDGKDAEFSDGCGCGWGCAGATSNQQKRPEGAKQRKAAQHKWVGWQSESPVVRTGNLGRSRES